MIPKDAITRFSESCSAIRLLKSPMQVFGRVASIDAAGIRVVGLSQLARLGDVVRFEAGGKSCFADIISIHPKHIVVKLLGNAVSVQLDMAVQFVGAPTFRPSMDWLGRCVSAMGNPIDGLGPLPEGLEDVGLQNDPLSANKRSFVKDGILTGVRCIDVFTPLCFGQRIGIFAGSGVGKSTLLAMIARSPGFDLAVIALVGERGREVNEFIHDVLGDALQKTVLVVATGDEAPGMRKMAPLLATRLAEFFRDKGNRVLLIMDSVTRYAMASREIALSAGEPPVSRGFPPSVFSELPQLLERSGPGLDNRSSITGVYSVLVDGDNHNEPVADAVRGILDGHIVLDREIANGGRFPAINVPESISRLAGKSWQGLNGKLAGEARQLINRFETSKDLRLLGGYQSGSDKELDHAIDVVPKLYSFLTQSASAPPDQEPFPMLQQIIRPQRPAQAASTPRATS